jgi:hypothetical protein
MPIASLTCVNAWLSAMPSEFGNRVGRGGGDKIAIHLRVWAAFVRRARINTHRKPRHLLDLREHPGLLQPPAGGRGERDRDLTLNRQMLTVNPWRGAEMRSSSILDGPKPVCQ